ncbi:MAG: hypothetical protein RLZ67_875, partial [Actinomycetota bacterium]
MSSFPEWAFAGALASLPLQTHHRLRRVLTNKTASQAWHDVMLSTGGVAGIPSHVIAAWRSINLSVVEKIHHTCVSLGVSVLTRNDASYPRQLLL